MVNPTDRFLINDINELVFPLCNKCKHLNRKNLKPHSASTCAAFPKGIPDEITDDIFDHHNPHPNDNGIQFESKA